MTAHPLSPPPLNNNINIDHVTNAKMVVVSMKEAPAPTAELDLAANWIWQLSYQFHHTRALQPILLYCKLCWIYH